jgi:2-polyprenyl-3-methyl-5-hydroxy-6-metoxy-1,4-benzoquinol methylase
LNIILSWVDVNTLNTLLHKEFNKHVLLHEEGYFETLVSFVDGKCPIEKKTIFEFGCGTGDLILLLAKGAKNVFGMDISEPSILEARKKAFKANVKNVNFQCGDIFETKIGSDKHDIIISNSVIHYIPGDLHPTLHILFSILKDGGTMFATVEAADKFSVIRMIQWFLFFVSPEVVKENLYMLFGLIPGVLDKDVLRNENKLVLKSKARYLAVPIVQIKTKDDWVGEFKRAGFSDVLIEMAPKLNKLSTPHYFITAKK